MIIRGEVGPYGLLFSNDQSLRTAWETESKFSWIHEISWKFNEISWNFNAKNAKPRPKMALYRLAQFGIDTGHIHCGQDMKSYRAIFDILHDFWEIHEISWKFREFFH